MTSAVRPQLFISLCEFREKPLPVKCMGYRRWLSGKKSTCQSTGDGGLIPGSRRSPGGGNGNPFWCSCLGNPLERGAWRATVGGVTKSRTRLSIGARTWKWQGIFSAKREQPACLSPILNAQKCLSQTHQFWNRSAILLYTLKLKSFTKQNTL